MSSNFFIRLFINAVAISIIVSLLPGINIVNNDIGTVLFVALIFGIVNAIIKPLMTLLSCSLIVLTLGLFLVVINGATLYITAALSGGRLTIDNFFWAIVGSILMSIINSIMEQVLDVDGARSKSS